MDQLDSIKKPVTKEIGEFEKHFKDSLQSKVPLLDTITNYVIRHKGKQIRPLFVFLSAKMMGDITPSTYTAATLIELLHTASLIHDDVVDESYERRNHFSINALWKTKIAVLVGDFFLSKGLLISVANNEYKLLETVSEAVREMSEGELLQIQTSRKSYIDIDNYFNIIQMKTASLIAACTKCGAQTGTSDPVVHQKMKQFGTFAGLAFQIKDDMFDYQSKGIIGKPIANDIREKKFTLPLILSLKKAAPKDSKRIIRLVGQNNKTAATVNEIIRFVINNDGLAESEKYLDDFKNKALEILHEFPGNEARKSLEALVEYVISRKK